MIYKWQSMKTGEVLPNILEVIKSVFYDLKHYHFINLPWKYNKNGF